MNEVLVNADKYLGGGLSRVTFLDDSPIGLFAATEKLGWRDPRLRGHFGRVVLPDGHITPERLDHEIGAMAWSLSCLAGHALYGKSSDRTSIVDGETSHTALSGLGDWVPEEEDADGEPFDPKMVDGYDIVLTGAGFGLFRDERYEQHSPSVRFHEMRGVIHIMDMFCPPFTVYGLKRANFKLLTLFEPSWMDRDGAKFGRIYDRVGHDAIFLSYFNLWCSAPEENLKISNLGTRSVFNTDDA